MKKSIGILIVIALVFATNASAQSSITKMQSLYMYNFIKNVQWKNINESYVVGVYANDATVDEISAVLGSRTFNGKSVTVKKISSASQASTCQLVFVSASNGKNIKSMSGLKNVLIVSEKGQFNNGASISFIVDNSKLKFKINETACKNAGLQVSTGLLALGV